MATTRDRDNDYLEDDEREDQTYDERWGRYGREMGEAAESGMNMFLDMMDLGVRMMTGWLQLGMRMILPMMGSTRGTRSSGRGRRESSSHREEKTRRSEGPRTN